jgi:GNAT superfamily N-acetyltransferase
MLDAWVDIAQFDGRNDAGTLESCYRLVQSCLRADQPAGQPEWSLPSFTGKWVDGFDSNPHESWAGTDSSGAVVGCYLLTLPSRENLSQATVVLRVAPDRRRAGIGGALLRHCAERARLAGRTQLAGDAWDDSSGAAFATAVGATAGIADVHRTLRFDDEARTRLPRLRQEAGAHAAGYTLFSFAGPTPEDLLDQVAAVRAAMADAPRDAGVQPFGWDAARVRRLEQVIAEHGMDTYTVAARHESSGELAAVTQMILDPGAPDCGIQQITAVLPSHRGRRLGLLVKVAMLELLMSAAPSIRYFVTDNAGANEHMIAINAQLGFEISGVTRNWYLDLAQFGAP